MVSEETAPLGDELRIVILGAGIGGTTAALSLAQKGFRNIDIYETSHLLQQVGAGINVTPNFGRVLHRLGVLSDVTKTAVQVAKYNVLESSDDTLLSSVDTSYLEKEFGFPFNVVHRADLHKALVDACKERNDKIKIHLGCSIEKLNFEESKVGIRRIPIDAKNISQDDGLVEEWIDADVILAADGIKSKARAQMLEKFGEVAKVEDTGTAAYRILLTREQMKDHPDLLELIDHQTSSRWIAPKRHIIAYPISNGQVYNISTTHPDVNFIEDPSSPWTTYVPKESMLKMFDDYCPRVKKMLNLVTEGEVCEWRLRVHRPLSNWSHLNVALLGDAAHPTLPHLAQGAAQAAEDGIVLGSVLSKIKSKQDIPKALRVYQALRKPRADFAVQQAAANSKGLHASDSESKEARNQAFKQATSGGNNPDKQISKETQLFLYGCDIAADADEKFNELFNSQLA